MQQSVLRELWKHSKNSAVICPFIFFWFPFSSLSLISLEIEVALCCCFSDTSSNTFWADSTFLSCSAHFVSTHGQNLSLTYTFHIVHTEGNFNSQFRGTGWNATTSHIRVESCNKHPINRTSLCFQLLQHVFQTLSPCTCKHVRPNMQTLSPNPQPKVSQISSYIPQLFGTQRCQQVLSPRAVYSATIIFSQRSLSDLFLQSPSYHKPGPEKCSWQKAKKVHVLSDFETRYQNRHTCKTCWLMHCTFSSVILTWNVNHYTLHLITHLSYIFTKCLPNRMKNNHPLMKY